MESWFPFHSKEMDTRIVLDASFLLVEDSGDSEADVGPNLGTVYLADDDAESCSWDVLDHFQVGDLEELDSLSTDNKEDQTKKKDYLHHPEVEEEEETSGYVGLQKNQKSCVSVESINNEPMNEMEKNRLFWEACLAS